MSRLTNLVVASAVLVGCGGGGGGDDITGDDAPLTTAIGVSEVAAALYDAVETDGDVASYLEGVFVAFDVPVLSEPTAELDDRIALGQPALFDPQMHELADAFADGGYVSIDSFLASATLRGVTGPGGQPLSRAAFDSGFVQVLTRSEYARAEVLPALVLALGRERAARYGGDDPIWGDGELDPLQTVLLMYAFSYGDPGRAPSTKPAPRGPAVFGSQVVINFVKERLQGQVEGQVVSWIEIPTDLDDDAAKSVLCSSLQLYGHKVTVSTVPDLIYHLQAENPTPPAHATTATAVLTFEDDWWDNRVPIDQWLFNELPGCKLARRGPVPEKPLAWEASDGIAHHGSYDFSQSITDDDGKGVGYWSTVVETTPVAKRTFANQRDAVGSLIVRASGLVPGWSTLERIVGFLRDTGAHGQDALTVIYYVDPCAPGKPGAVPGPDQCVDIWRGSSESTLTTTDGGYRITGTDLVWTPVLTDTEETSYALTGGTIHYEQWQTGCTTTIDPASVTFDPSGISESDLVVRWADTPKTFTGNGSMMWMATITLDCGSGPGSYQNYVGTQFFRADVTMTDGTTLADDYTLTSPGGDTHFVYSFQR